MTNFEVKYWTKLMLNDMNRVDDIMKCS